VVLVLMAQVCACRLVWNITSPAINPNVAISIVFMFVFPLVTLSTLPGAGLLQWSGTDLMLYFHLATSRLAMSKVGVLIGKSRIEM
jgi:hypothetical protein